MAESKMNTIQHRQSTAQPFEGSSDSSGSDEEDVDIKPQVKWVIPQRLNAMTFIGKEVLAVANDLYIVFLNLKTGSESIYVANDKKKGDGVDLIAGYKASMFAFTEKVMNPRIFIASYPTFGVVAELRDDEVNRYKGLCMMEQELVAAFSGFPNYVVSVWSWRNKQKLLSIPTGVVRRNQIYMASRAHPLICECWGEGLVVWEVAQCYKRCFMMKRSQHGALESSISGVCWANDNALYAIDDHARLYSVTSDGIGMVLNLEWDACLHGENKPCVCAFHNGVLIYGPDNNIRALTKSEHKWRVSWCHEPRDSVARLMSNCTADVAAVWTEAGFVYKLTADSDDKIDFKLFTYKQRNITKVQLLAPDSAHIAVINETGMLCIYETRTGKLVLLKQINATDVCLEASPVAPVLAISGLVGDNYGITMQAWGEGLGLTEASHACLTHQIISRIVISPTGTELVAAAMAAGHVFVYSVSSSYQLTIVRYAELGRGLADVLMTHVGDHMRTLALVRVSDNYPIGERIVCIDAVTGSDNRVSGSLAGPYCRLQPLVPGCVLAIRAHTKTCHVLRLKGDKGITVNIKMDPVMNSGHDMKYFDAFFNPNCLLTYGYDGVIIKRQPSVPEEYDFKLTATHRYESGIKQAMADARVRWLVHLAANGNLVVQKLHTKNNATVKHEPVSQATLNADTVRVIGEKDKNYLDILEDKKVHEEAMDFKKQREDVVSKFKSIQAKVLDLLEENIAEVPLHQLSLSEFNLHLEHKKERLREAEKERELIRLETEARIRAQDKVTLWIKSQCWDTMVTPRVKLFAIFSHYQVENYAVLPGQRALWPELQQAAALRDMELELHPTHFTPWVEPEPVAEASIIQPLESQILVSKSQTWSVKIVTSGGIEEEGGSITSLLYPHVMGGSLAHQFINIPPYMIPQAEAYSFLHMNWLQQFVRLNVQNMRLWFNKQFDELMALKRREVGLVAERNARLRFIIEELNKLSDLRGSFHHLAIRVQDPEWRQEELPEKLIKVEPEECSIEPYISPSQVVIPPPEPKPKDDFKERALMDMMDGVLEKLWHEEIKKPIPMPQCMLDKDPEHFNEEDLRHVFDYEAKVRFREEERDKYRRALHAEHAKLRALTDEGIVNFNWKVKDMWLTKLKVDSVIGQETLNLMRLRRINLDRVEAAEELENMRATINKLDKELEQLAKEQKLIQDQHDDVQGVYDALAHRDRALDKGFRNHFADLSSIIVDQCYKFFKKRPKWVQRVSMTPCVLYELASAILTGVRPALLHADTLDYCRAVELSDNISNMPPVMDEGLWVTMCKHRRIKIENEIRMRAVVQELGYVELAQSTWSKASLARRTALTTLHSDVTTQRARTELAARNKPIQLVLPAGQVEITTTGHMEDFEDATLILKEDIGQINDLILRVGGMKLRMMRKQMEFRKGILSKEWEHAAMKMKLDHLKQELYSYQRLKIPKELQLYLKNKELGYTEDMEYTRMEKEVEATKVSVNKLLEARMNACEELQLKSDALEVQVKDLEKLVTNLNLKVSEKRLNEDQLEPIRVRRALRKRMETLMMRGKLIREVQQNHTSIVLLQTELELLRLRTYPTLAPVKTLY